MIRHASPLGAPSPPLEGQRPSPDETSFAGLPWGPFGVGITVAALGFLAAGILWPQGAWALLRILVATVSLGYVASRLYEAGLPERTTHDVYSPFEGHVGERARPSLPTTVWTLAAQLEAANDRGAAATTSIPWPIGRTLVQEATRRLAEHHGLYLGEPTHRAAARALVSEPTWLLIDPGGGDGGGGAPGYVDYRAVPMSRLEAILEDLERL